MEATLAILKYLDENPNEWFPFPLLMARLFQFPDQLCSLRFHYQLHPDFKKYELTPLELRMRDQAILESGKHLYCRAHQPMELSNDSPSHDLAKHLNKSEFPPDLAASLWNRPKSELNITDRDVLAKFISVAPHFFRSGYVLQTAIQRIRHCPRDESTEDIFANLLDHCITLGFSKQIPGWQKLAAGIGPIRLVEVLQKGLDSGEYQSVAKANLVIGIVLPILCARFQRKRGNLGIYSEEAIAEILNIINSSADFEAKQIEYRKLLVVPGFRYQNQRASRLVKRKYRVLPYLDTQKILHGPIENFNHYYSTIKHLPCCPQID